VLKVAGKGHAEMDMYVKVEDPTENCIYFPKGPNDMLTIRNVLVGGKLHHL
jgi:hypothetical protein